MDVEPVQTSCGSQTPTEARQSVPPSVKESAGQSLGRLISHVLTWVLLVPFFYLCFTPGRLILILRKKDPLHRQCPSSETSYWVTRPPIADLDQYRGAREVLEQRACLRRRHAESAQDGRVVGGVAHRVMGHVGRKLAAATELARICPLGTGQAHHAAPGEAQHANAVRVNIRLGAEKGQRREGVRIEISPDHLAVRRTISARVTISGPPSS